MNQPAHTNTHIGILIQLGQGGSSGALPTDQLVQLRNYQKLKAQIAIHLDSIQKPAAGQPKQVKHPFGSGWTHFIDGSRGAGKSTFLSSVKEALEADAAIKHRIAFFDVIDPSRIEKGEIPLLIILQVLRKRVELVLKGHSRLEDGSRREEWRRAFSRVAGGLSLFAKDYHPLNDLDPELFLDWGLERARNSTGLREALHNLFELACSIMNVDALVFGFDDADTDSRLAVSVLECIRKYLDTPRVMVLVTGDLELYSILMRQRFAETVAGKPEAALDLQRRSKQGDRSTQYLRMIDHLEEQYLLKLFPIRRRLQLQPLWSVILRDECLVTHPEWKQKTMTVEEAVRAIVTNGLRVKTNSDVSLYTEFLLKQPLRTVLQVLERCAPHLVDQSNQALDPQAVSPDLIDELSRSLQALALTSLYKLSVNTDEIAARELPALVQAVFDLSLADGDYDSAPYLRPMSANPDIQASFAALAGEVPNFCGKEPGIALRYLLRGPGSVSIYSLAQGQLDAKDPSNSSDVVAEFTSYMGVGRREDSLDWARRATAVIAQPFGGNSTRRVVAPGIVGLRRNNKGRPGEFAYSKAVKDAIKSPGKSLPVFLFGVVHVVGDSSPRTYGSIYVILGLIEKLLSLAAKKDTTTAQFVFNRACTSLTVSAPSWSLKGGTEIEVDKRGDDSDSDELLKSSRDALWEQVEAWLENVEDLYPKILPSGIFLGKVWSRLYFSLQNAADELKAENFGTVMEIFVQCILNAFLVEEAEHHKLAPTAHDISDEVRVESGNPRSSAVYFVKKLKQVKPEREKFPFTAIMATCPLILGLLDNKKGYAEALQPLFPAELKLEQIDGLLCSTDTFALMEKVSVAGGNSPGKRESADAAKGPADADKSDE